MSTASITHNYTQHITFPPLTLCCQYSVPLTLKKTNRSNLLEMLGEQMKSMNPGLNVTLVCSADAEPIFKILVGTNQFAAPIKSIGGTHYPIITTLEIFSIQHLVFNTQHKTVHRNIHSFGDYIMSSCHFPDNFLTDS